MDYTRLTLWIETNGGESASTYRCQACGAIVANRQLHDAWHDRVEPS